MWITFWQATILPHIEVAHNHSTTHADTSGPRYCCEIWLWCGMLNHCRYFISFVNTFTSQIFIMIQLRCTIYPVEGYWGFIKDLYCVFFNGRQNLFHQLQCIAIYNIAVITISLLSKVQLHNQIVFVIQHFLAFLILFNYWFFFVDSCFI